ncbi:MAG: hypothetical protein ACTHJX_03855 [Terriglobales bacterium]
MDEARPAYELGPADVVARFLHHNDEIRANGRVHFSSLMPDRSGERSVAHINGLDEAAIWSLGSNTLSPPQWARVTGRADIPVEAVIRVRLRAIRDDLGFVRHAKIAGWPEGADDKSAQQELARALAQAATAVRA